ncbi:MAG: hypothetical protein M3P48_02035 [Actinomycetota bacterium]|nr:hypothetical protein [Actinomycetota bacterium]
MPALPGVPVSDRGATLAEVLVASFLLGIVGTLVMQVSVQTSRVVVTAAERGGDVQDARSATAAITRALRTAVDPDGSGPKRAFLDSSEPDATLQSDPRQVAFYASIDEQHPCRQGLPALFRYELLPSGDLVEEVRLQAAPPATTECAAFSTTKSRVLARGLATTGRPLFTYLAATDVTTNPDGTTVSSLTSALAPKLEPADVDKVAAVEIWLSPTVTAKGGGRPVTVVDRVALPNDLEVIVQ